MITYKAFRPAYRLLQHAMMLEAVYVMTAPTAAVAATANADSKIETQALTAETLQRFISRSEAPYTELFAPRLVDPQLTCVGAIADNRLLSFAFFHQGAAECDMNYGRTPVTATRIALQPDAAFVFHAYTAPDARGRGLLSTVLSRGAALLRESHGVQSLVTTTEVVNDAARRAFHRAGFRDAGVYWRYGWGKKIFGRYPQVVAPILGYNLN